MTPNGARPTVHRTAAATVAASLARRRSAAERDAVELAERVDLLSPATVAKHAELLIARCVGTLDDATLIDLTDQLLVECERRGLPVPEL